VAGIEGELKKERKRAGGNTPRPKKGGLWKKIFPIHGTIGEEKFQKDSGLVLST